MKCSRLLLSLVATVSAVMHVQVAYGQVADPGQAGSATISGAVVADGTGFPIPFSTVRLQPTGRERFADREGSFVYYSVSPGSYELQVRMLGYLPVDSVIRVGPNATMALTITMTRIPTSLDEVTVSAPPRMCIFPDEMGSVADPELALVLNEARKNAQREQLLRRTYPFEYRLAQSHDTHDVVTRRSSLQYDTVTYRSDDSWRYRRGRVVSDDRNRLFGEVRLMRLPTLSDLADRHFLSSHCFKYSGVVDEGEGRAHRIDFLTDSSLVAPDVEGSIFLDSATYLIKRAQFRLTRGGTVRPPILGLEVTTTYNEILPNVALFDEIRAVQPLYPENPGGNPREFREVQRLLSFRFLYTGPNGNTGRKWIPADSALAVLAAPESRSYVCGWCVQVDTCTQPG
ncbi:MAG: carboxypeptidase regulatory-like domain-containing protein, partial [Gemmatimonadaceae bacterium]